jgi:hypothetical protein
VPARRVLPVLVAAACLAAAGVARGSEPLAWTRLRLEASKALVLRGSVEVTARSVATAELDLEDCAEGAGRSVRGPQAIVLAGRANSTVSKPSMTTAVLDAATLGVVQTDDLRPGRRLKRRRFLDGGDHVWRRRPDDRGQRRGDPEAWTLYREEHEAWPDVAVGDVPVTDGHSLLYQAAAARLDREGQTLEVLLWTHDRLVRLVLRAAEAETVDARFRRHVSGQWVRVAGPVSARRVTVDVEPLSPEGLPEDLDVLGMKRGVELALEVGTGLPLEVRGEVPPVGRVVVRLVEAE